MRTGNYPNVPVGESAIGGKSLAVLLLVAMLVAPLATRGEDVSEVVVRFHSRVPLGSEQLQLTPSKANLILLASVESSRFEGWERVGMPPRAVMREANGERVKQYPRRLSFRVSADLVAKLLDTETPLPVEAAQSPEEYISGLRFRLKIFHALRQTTVSPAAEQMMGVPADIAANRRIYRITFDLPEVSIEDRVVLEVLAPNGERVMKFHVDLL